ncbi:unnamed protein product [Didymodactylos carnosus]|uniref:Uncharacterized protein n=1 Tax=Didymodactylos carnosus TaxID=1234261 RepID=A0A815GMD6_9BILA|nr:unnamed protein product [Didymodactylos carnosus]CAF1377142.1 unnamed protein product [Didymodactylos carnosus]CAF4185851.1 unnamed protein product [Didymodactylos carnosus]CAF4204033.1 unnamed protein product [Didymodactylos carnosus]
MSFLSIITKLTILYILTKIVDSYSYAPALHSCAISACRINITFNQEFNQSACIRRSAHVCSFTLLTSTRANTISLTFRPGNLSPNEVVNADYQYSYKIVIDTEQDDVQYDITYSCYKGDICDIEYLTQLFRERLNIKYNAMWRLFDPYFMNSEIAHNLECSDAVDDTNITTTTTCNGGLCKAHMDYVQPSQSTATCVPDNVYRQVFYVQKWYANWTEKSVLYYCNQNYCNGHQSFNAIKDILNRYNFSITESWTAPPPTTIRTPSSAYTSIFIKKECYGVWVMALYIMYV